jgi:hydroxymethylglutaryl-CoA synthase
MSFVQDQEDVNSISLTALKNLMTKYGVNPLSVGRLEVGTETLLDKAKSMKPYSCHSLRKAATTTLKGSRL